jgi:hypothetical protein
MHTRISIVCRSSGTASRTKSLRKTLRFLHATDEKIKEPYKGAILKPISAEEALDRAELDSRCCISDTTKQDSKPRQQPVQIGEATICVGKNGRRRDGRFPVQQRLTENGATYLRLVEAPLA